MTPAPAPAEEQANWYSLLEQGQYDEGLRLVRAEAAQEADPEKRNQAIATGLFLAFVKGHHEAADQLRIFVETNPEFSEGHEMYALVLSDMGKAEQAEAELREAQERATTEERKLGATRRYASHLVRGKRVPQAIDLLKQQLGTIRASKLRSQLYVALAEAFLAAEPVAVPEAMLAYELALRETPTDKELLFAVAYKYSENSANGLALYHYGSLLAHEPSAITLNNAGVAAEALKLPIMAVDYFRRSEEQGETLAASNLASRFLTAGFKREAQGLLQSLVSKNEMESLNPRVYDVLAQVASAEAAEVESTKKQLETVRKLLPWRLRQAEAMLADSPNRGALAGQHVGKPDLNLDVDESGNVSGSFEVLPTLAAIGNSGAASFKGVVKGRAVVFTWKLLKADWFSPRPTSGHGVLIWSERGLSGFRVGGDWRLDLVGAEGFSEWELTKDGVS